MARLHASNTEGRLLRDRMRSGERPLGMFITSADSSTSEIMALAGADFLVIDSEHGAIDRLIALQHIRAAEAHGCVPLVRILEGTPTVIQSFLEVGARGIIVPHVDDADAAATVVAATRYPPQGTRGACSICHSASYGLSAWVDVCDHANDSVLAIPLIESVRAVTNIDEIVATPGVDTIFFGPGDLSTDLGVQNDMSSFSAPELLDAWSTVLAACRRNGTLVMLPFGFEAGLSEAHAVTVAGDLSLLAVSARDRLSSARSRLC